MLTTRSRPISGGYARFDRGEFRWFYKANPARIRVRGEAGVVYCPSSKRDVRGLVSHKLPNRTGPQRWLEDLERGRHEARRASSVSVLWRSSRSPGHAPPCQGLQPGRHESCRADGKLRRWNWTEHQAVRWTASFEESAEGPVNRQKTNRLLGVGPAGPAPAWAARCRRLCEGNQHPPVILQG